MDIEAPEVDQFTRRINLGLERCFALAEHRRRVHHRAPTRGQQVRGLEENGGAVGETPVRPVTPSVARRCDGARDFFGAGLMHLGQHVAMAVRHHCVDRLSGSDLLAAHDDGDLDLPAAQVLEGLFELTALARAGGVGEDGLVDRGRDFGCVHAGKCNRGT